MFRHRCLESTIVASSLLLAIPALAQDASPAANQQTPAPRKKTQKNGVEDIIVTATKARTNARKTPISMEILTGAAIAQKGITDIQSLANQNASVNFATGGGSGYATIRGVASQNTTEIGDPAVPISTDGFFLNRPYTFNESLYDVARIEVLRGPQGTLYGRNATGGVINVIDNDPTNKLGGFEQVTIGNYGTINTTGAINIPVSNSFQLRASYSQLRHDGYRSNGNDAHGDTEDAKSVRVKAAWEPTEHFKSSLTLQYTHVGGTGPTDEVLPLQFQASGDINHDVHYTGNGSSFPLTFLPSQEIDEKAMRWSFAYDNLPGETTLAYLGGYDLTRWTHNAPSSSTGDQAFLQHESPKTQNHELRLSSSPGRFTWQIGAFYFREDNNLDSGLYNHNAPPTDLLYAFDYGLTTASYAGFGQGTYKLTDQLSLTGGVRYTYDTKERDGTFNLKEYGLMFPDNEHGSWSKPTWHVGLDYNPTNNILVYAKADSGYKSGGFNGDGKPQYQPETLMAYELGTKDRFFHNDLSVNADVFYEDYSNQQVSELAAIGSGGTGVVIQNAGSSKIYGLDIGGQLIAGAIGKFDLNLTLLHAQISNFLAANAAGTANFQLSGNQLPQAPNVSLTAGFEHSWDVLRGSVTARIETKFQSSQYFSFFNYPDSRVAPLTMSNAFLRYEDGYGHYTIELYVKNLENSTVLADYAENLANNFYNFGFAPPRTYGARLRFSF